MSSTIDKLYHISQKSERLIIGLMSGTSLDGLDIALCKISGAGVSTKLQLLNFKTINYTQDIKDTIQSVFSKKYVALEKLCLVNEWIGVLHGKMVNECLQEWGIANETIDAIASHGQTIYHAPKSMHGLASFGSGTLQIGDGDHIAVATGIITLSDFRQKHIAAGGEGAPLALYGDYLLFSDATEERIMLNIGGIANFTYLPTNNNINEIICTDTGPGNTLMDAYVRHFFKDKAYDVNGELALQGQCNTALLQQLLLHTFFNQPFPKTTGPEMFHLPFVQEAISAANVLNILPEDVLATLNQFTAITIANAINMLVPAKSIHIYPSGGGMHNAVLMKHLQHLLPNATFANLKETGIHPDAKEAVLFAVLANETLAQKNAFAGSQTATMPAITMGKISLPH